MNKKSYQDVEILVQSYQEGNQLAGEELVRCYMGFIQKLTNVVCLNKTFDIKDRTQRSFIKLFMKDNAARDNINHYKRSGVVIQQVDRTVYQIRKVLAVHDEYEIKNELILLFLEMATKHNKQGLFGGYINDYFTLRASTVIVKMIKEKQRQDEYELDIYDNDGGREDYIDLDEKPYYEILGNTATEFNENWVNGYTCSSIFSTLTTYERRILKWHYEWKTYKSGAMILPDDIMKERKERFRHTDSDIADLLGCSRKTVVMKRKEAVACVETQAQLIHKITR